MLLFLLFGWLLLRIETRALSSLLFHEPPRRPDGPCPDIPPLRERTIPSLFDPCPQESADFGGASGCMFILSDR